MQDSGSGPRTEADLLTVVPGTNRANAFPRELLDPGERVLFETRPSLFGLYWGRFVLLALLLLFFGYIAAKLPTNPFGWFLVALFTLLIVYYVLKGRSTAYALTHRRVLTVVGIRQPSVMDALYGQIQNLRLEPGVSGGVKFDATPPEAPVGLLGGRKYAKTIYWRALPESALVYAFVQQAFAVEAALGARAATLAELTARAVGNRIPCDYCGNLVDPSVLDPLRPRCPSCGAPFLSDEARRTVGRRVTVAPAAPGTASYSQGSAFPRQPPSSGAPGR